jgi:hypothetical protein
MKFVEENPSSFATPPPSRLIHILSDAAARNVDDAEFSSTANINKDDVGISLISNSFAAILRLGLLQTSFWKEISTDDAFHKVILELVLLDMRKSVRGIAVNLIEDAIDNECQRAFNASTDHSHPDSAPSYPIAGYFWNIIRSVLTQAVNVPAQCQELFRASHFLLIRVAKTMPEVLDLEKLLQQTSGLLLRHTSSEVS